MKKSILKIMALILLCTSFFSFAVYMSNGENDDNSWYYTDFGLSEEYIREDISERLTRYDKFYLPKAPVIPWVENENGEIDVSSFTLEGMMDSWKYTLADDLLQKSSIVLVVDPGHSNRHEKNVERSVQFIHKDIDGCLSNSIDHGMTFTLCNVIKVCRNTSQLKLEETGEVWIKESYYCRKDPNGSKVFYSPYGHYAAPIDDISLIFAEVYENDTQTPVLKINEEIHFYTETNYFINGSMVVQNWERGERLVEHAAMGLYAYYDELSSEFRDETLAYFNVSTASNNRSISDKTALGVKWALIGFGVGAAVVLVPTICIIAAKKKKAKKRPADSAPQDLN